MELCAAVSELNLQLVRTLLEAGHDANAVRPPGGEDQCQPDRPLKMVVFRLSDAMLSEDDHKTLADIARLLLRHGADPVPAQELAEMRYGAYPGPGDTTVWEAWHVIAATKVISLHASALQEDGSADVQCVNLAGETLVTISAPAAQSIANFRKVLADAMDVPVGLLVLLGSSSSPLADDDLVLPSVPNSLLPESALTGTG
eukprot:gb/GFBE01042760.1/.p1 GENE.gb/GFBE01042760.1/~~gb/GFBE01042760.1/.p1  ORF type:complete len:201 (+),score=24.83 gb/GFBE01042760.1/:1-603(+)